MEEERLTQSQKIQILLAEYSSLRSHIVSRSALSIQAVAIGVASLGIVATQLKDKPVLSLSIMGMMSLIIAVIGRFIHRDLHEEAAHVCRLEARINALAGGEQLLTWETERGRATTGYWHGFIRTGK